MHFALSIDYALIRSHFINSNFCSVIRFVGGVLALCGFCLVRF